MPALRPGPAIDRLAQLNNNDWRACDGRGSAPAVRRCSTRSRLRVNDLEASSFSVTGRPLLSQCSDGPPRATLHVHVLRKRRVLVDDTQDLLATEIRHLQKGALNAGLSILAENCRVCWSTKYGDR